MKALTQYDDITKRVVDTHDKVGTGLNDVTDKLKRRNIIVSIYN